jgi:hypothetical protein
MALQIFNKNDLRTASAFKGAGKGDFHTGAVLFGGKQADVVIAPYVSPFFLI